MHAQARAARSAAHARERTDAAPAGWGVVDVILAVVLLPFALGFVLIDRAVAVIAWLIDDMQPLLRRGASG